MTLIAAGCVPVKCYVDPLRPEEPTTPLPYSHGIPVHIEARYLVMGIEKPDYTRALQNIAIRVLDKDSVLYPAYDHQPAAILKVTVDERGDNFEQAANAAMTGASIGMLGGQSNVDYLISFDYEGISGHPGAKSYPGRIVRVVGTQPPPFQAPALSGADAFDVMFRRAYRSYLRDDIPLNQEPPRLGSETLRN